MPIFFHSVSGFIITLINMRYLTVNVRDIAIGRGLPIVVQTMCNCDTNDVEAAVKQCKDLYNAGAQMIRLTTQGLKEVDSLRVIKERLHSSGIFVPLVADIHFSSATAIAAASVADKVRINPGNFAPEHEKACFEFRRFISECKKYGTAVRIGINHGSLGRRITEIYGNTPQGMVKAMSEWVKMCIDEDFFNVVLSLKASNPLIMVSAYRLLNEWMNSIGIIFPLHLGVTEAGNGDMGRIKSTIGLSALLKDGIGETIRVSLTEPPVNEIPVAKFIADYFNPSTYIKKNLPSDISDFHYISKSKEDFILEASAEIGPLLLDKKIDDFTISCISDGKMMESSEIDDFKNNIYQAARRRFSKCEYVACPGCGRTLYNLEETFNEVKKRTSHLKGLVIAVMGCIVNGPGEMADADYGYVGQGRGKVSIYRGKEAVYSSVPQEEAIDTLLKLIDADSKR